MSKNNFSSEVDNLNSIPAFSGSNWGSIKPEYAARMRLQNQFKSGIDIAKIYSFFDEKGYGCI